MGEEGFTSDSSLLYHRNLPSALVDSRVWALADDKTEPNHPLKPYHFRLHELFPSESWRQSDPVRDRRVVLGNADLRIAYVAAGLASPLYRNAIGDECVYVESGSGVLESVFGSIEVGEGDYVVVPRATTHRWLPTGDAPLRLYAVEANSHITPARRYLSKFGQLLEHAPYCERDLRGPVGPLVSDEPGDVEVYVKHRVGGAVGGTVFTTPSTPSTWSAGTAASTPTPSASATSSRSPGGSTSRRRCTRCSRATAL
ncbi:cupin domain-containing protein [Streptacidiphilus sp. 4-A2]|nr:cupin domain-containing protein [Streptacidiphilus sp. 4-A2]